MTIQDIMKKYDLKLDEEFEIVFKHQEGVKVRSVYKLTEIAENTIIFAYPPNGKIQFDPMMKILNGIEFEINKFVINPENIRNIKFRAWDVQEKHIRPVQCIRYADDGSVDTVYVTLVGIRDEKVHGKNCILMQCTGLKDKNDRDIYVGDIVEAWDRGVKAIKEVRLRQDGNPRYILYPAFSNNQWYIFGAKQKDGTYCDANVEVIGNIYEDPELLKS